MARITKEQIARYLEVKSERLEIDRRSRKLDREEKAIRAEIVAECDRNDGGFTRFGFRCILVERAGRPRWQDELILRLGAETAASIEAATPPSFTLQVHSSS